MGQSLDFLLFPPVNAAKLRHGRIAPGCAGEFLPCPSSGVQQVTPREPERKKKMIQLYEEELEELVNKKVRRVLEKKSMT